MPYIRVIEPEDAEGELREEYERLLGSRGKLAAIHTIHSLSPQALRAHMDLYMTLMFGRSKLKRDVREAIAVVVSRAVALTRDPSGARREDVERLRALGISDEEILDLTLITSYFNFVNRIALGLGVEVTEGEAQGYRY